MNRQPSLQLAIGQPVGLHTDTGEKTGFIAERDYNGLYMVRWDDGFCDTREHINDLFLLSDDE